MGKKKHKKNKKNKSKYTRKQFLDIYCINCNLCSTQPPDPIFCYDELYKTDPDRFFEGCFLNLVETAREMRESNSSNKSITMNKFRELFCKSFCKYDSCGLTVDCFNLFKDQINGKAPRSKTNMRKKRRERKKKRQKYICQPYPTTFTNDNKDWQIKIENILSNENNNREQNKVKESTR